MWWAIVGWGVAQGADLDTWIVAWTAELDGDRGTDGRDEAFDVAIDQTQHVVVAGYLDGDAGLGRTALLATFERHDGSLLWSLREEAGALSATDDVYFGVDFAPASNELAWCGQRAGIDGPEPVDPLTAYFVDARVPDLSGIHFESDPLWSEGFEAVPGTGRDQACRSLDRAGLNLFTTGDVATAGGGRQWITRVQAANSGELEDGATFALADPADVERGLAVAGDPLNTEHAVVGSSSIGETESRAVIRFVEAGGAVRWSDTVESPGDGPATFHDVVYDTARGLVAAVGTYQRGTEAASDRQGFVRIYTAAGQDGSPDAQLTLELTGSPGDDHATSVAFDADGRLLVGGSLADATTGIERWHVVRLSESTGDVLSTWEGPTTSGHSRIQAIAQRDEVLVAVGFVDRGLTVDAGVVMLNPDRDRDGVADIVDQCPDDPDKILQGICDCGVSEVDTDGDGFEDCIDRCPEDPEKTTREGECGCGVADVDSDRDDVPDCLDLCPADRGKVDPGVCGCGDADDDRDQDGVLDCNDACPDSLPGLAVDTDGCEPSGSACGCGPSTSGAPPWGIALGLLVGFAWRRRSESKRYPVDGPALERR